MFYLRWKFCDARIIGFIAPKNNMVSGTRKSTTQIIYLFFIHLFFANLTSGERKINNKWNAANAVDKIFHLCNSRGLATRAEYESICGRGSNPSEVD